METSEEHFAGLLKLSGITNVYFVDDYLLLNQDIDSLVVMIDSHAKEKPKELITGLMEFLDLSKVPPDEIGNQTRKFYDAASSDAKDAFASRIYKLKGEQFESEVKNTLKVLELFPKEMARGIHPTEWDEFRKGKLAEDIKSGKALLLMDQDLSNAEGFATRRGIDLILDLSKEPYFEKLTCILISNDILATKDELPTRNELIKSLNLKDSDFFPLSKKRLDLADLFYDGVKKSMINRYCEVIKKLTVEIIDKAYANALIRVKNINTYDFDHAIFQSSYEEGVWEIETLFRLSDIFIDDEIKNTILSSGFQKEINTQLRKAKQLSDIRFKIEKHTEPYAEKYKLRHLEIYESSAIINPMYKPLDNGDIFEIYDGHQDAKGSYILLGQECDLMVRKDGTRESKLGFLYKIEQHELEAFLAITQEHYEKHRRDFYDAKFKLDYFKSGTNDVGIVSFKNPIVVDLKILDLTAFNADGRARFELNKPLDSTVLSFAWEKKYSKINEFLNVKSGWAVRAYHTLEKLKDATDAEVKEYLQFNNRLKLSLTRPEVGSQRTLIKGVYDFGIKRTTYFRRPGNTILLDILTKYQSRQAELHDFALNS